MGLEELTATDGMIVGGLPAEDTSELIPEPPSKVGKKEKPGKKGGREPTKKPESGSGITENPVTKGKEAKRKREVENDGGDVAALQVGRSRDCEQCRSLLWLTQSSPTHAWGALTSRKITYV